MRYVLLIFLQIFIFAAQGLCQSSMRFAQTVYDFGTIKELDGSVSHTFEFTNTGKRPFVIENVSVSCGCTTPTYSKAPIMPGKTGKIVITYDPIGRPGEFLKEIVITSDNRANRNMIKIKGNVTPRPRTVQDDYPMELSSGVRLSTLNLNFRYVPRGKSSSMSVALINTSKKSVDISSAVEPRSGCVKVSRLDNLCAGCKGEITVTYDFSPEDHYGVVSNDIFLTIDGVRQNIPISATAIFVDDFSELSQQQMEDAPRARLSAQYYNFGDVRPGQTLTYEITITNAGELPLIVRDVAPSDGVQVSLLSGASIAPSQSVVVRFTIDGKQIQRGRLYKSIVLIMNDPARAMREVRLSANVQ